MPTEQQTNTATGWQKFVAWLKRALMEIEKFLVKLFTFWKKVEKKLDEAGLLPKLEDDAKAELKSSEKTETPTKETVAPNAETNSNATGDVITIPPATSGSDLTATGTSEKAK